MSHVFRNADDFPFLTTIISVFDYCYAYCCSFLIFKECEQVYLHLPSSFSFVIYENLLSLAIGCNLQQFKKNKTDLNIGTHILSLQSLMGLSLKQAEMLNHFKNHTL